MKKMIYFFQVLKHKNLLLGGVFLLSVGILELNAQNTNPASGSNASGSGGTMSYTVGQIAYTKNTGTNGSVAQGVQQPYEISVITGIKEAKDISLEIVAFPNPATDFIKLNIMNFEVDNLSYQLYDINGSILQNNKIDSNETTISIQNLRPSTYFLKVIQGLKDIKTFKIIKN